MLRKTVMDRVHEISAVETALTAFNARRALSNQDKEVEIMCLGTCTLLIEPHSPKSIYYNRVKGFGAHSVKLLDEILDIYNAYGIVPSFDITPNDTCDLVSEALIRKGYRPVDNLVFMMLDKCYDSAMIQSDDQIVIKEVHEDNAEIFINLILESNPHMSVSEPCIQKKKPYFYLPEFHNYILYGSGQPAALGSLYIKDKIGYVANDFTFENMRGFGFQKTLLLHRIGVAKSMGLESIYTDVEFGSISHNNMKKLGFTDVFMSTYWTK